MKIFKRKLEYIPRNNKAYNMYFQNKSFAVFDIETTGLSPKNSVLLLSGIIVVKDNNATAYELLAETLDDEREIIEKTLLLLSSVDYIVTFNGKHFDVPFLQKRAYKYGLNVNLGYNLDIYLLLSTSKDFKSQLPDMKQKSVENHIGIGSCRKDTITGKESADLFIDYLSSHNPDIERKILLHNYDDICQLYKLIDALSYIDIHAALYKRGFPAEQALIEKIYFKGHDLQIEGRACMKYDYIAFPSDEFPCQINCSHSKGTFEISIICDVASGSIFFDAQKLLGKDIINIEKYPWISSGYLIAATNGTPNILEINAFVLQFIPKLLSNIKN